MVEANWSGTPPCLCWGQWTLKINGIDVTDKIPKKLRGSSMNTYGIYQKWSLDKSFIEHCETYEDGLNLQEWIQHNKYWLDTITDDYNIQKEIFLAIQKKDFRMESCGGCI